MGLRPGGYHDAGYDCKGYPLEDPWGSLYLHVRVVWSRRVISYIQHGNFASSFRSASFSLHEIHTTRPIQWAYPNNDSESESPSMDPSSLFIVSQSEDRVQVNVKLSTGRGSMETMTSTRTLS